MWILEDGSCLQTIRSRTGCLAFPIAMPDSELVLEVTRDPHFTNNLFIERIVGRGNEFAYKSRSKCNHGSENDRCPECQFTEKNDHLVDEIGAEEERIYEDP